MDYLQRGQTDNMLKLQMTRGVELPDGILSPKVGIDP
jgi:hypothetical protein